MWLMTDVKYKKEKTKKAQYSLSVMLYLQVTVVSKAMQPADYMCTYYNKETSTALQNVKCVGVFELGGVFKKCNLERRCWFSVPLR